MERKPMTCPHCDGVVSVAAMVPSSQTMEVTLDSEAEHFDAQGVGDVLTSLAKSLRGVAESLGTKVAVFVEDIKVKPYRVTVSLLVVDAEKETMKAKGGDDG